MQQYLVILYDYLFIQRDIPKTITMVVCITMHSPHNNQFLSYELVKVIFLIFLCTNGSILYVI